MSSITRCSICNESSESNVYDDCSSKKGCKVCNIMTKCNTFCSYKNGELYSTCKECFNKKLRCEFCNEELNKSYLRSHISKQQLYPQGYSHSFAQVSSQVPTQVPTHNNNNNNNNNINNNNNDNGRPFVRFSKAMKLPLSKNETMSRLHVEIDIQEA